MLVFAIQIFVTHPPASRCLLSGRLAAAVVGWLRVKVSIPCWPAQLAQLAQLEKSNFELGLGEPGKPCLNDDLARYLSPSCTSPPRCSGTDCGRMTGSIVLRVRRLGGMVAWTVGFQETGGGNGTREQCVHDLPSGEPQRRRRPRPERLPEPAQAMPGCLRRVPLARGFPACLRVQNRVGL